MNSLVVELFGSHIIPCTINFYFLIVLSYMVILNPIEFARILFWKLLLIILSYFIKLILDNILDTMCCTGQLDSALTLQPLPVFLMLVINVIDIKFHWALRLESKLIIVLYWVRWARRQAILKDTEMIPTLLQFLTLALSQLSNPCLYLTQKQLFYIQVIFKHANGMLLVLL